MDNCIKSTYCFQQKVLLCCTSNYVSVVA
ncbi:hypothetical protein C5167_030544 [Papaver somniferum]|nr:hypothetical protein C5167_030544 [Papaver somniferum]